MQERDVTTVIQGEVAISKDPKVVFGTLLGSCISVCMYDPFERVGGMNHFLLPDGGDASDDSETAMRFGVNAMEKLINGILKLGGRRDNLTCKVFGGASVIASLGRVGQENIVFVKNYIRAEGLKCLAHSLGGNRARRIRFSPTTGRAMQSLVLDSTASAIGWQEEKYRLKEREAEQRWKKQAGSDLELF